MFTPQDMNRLRGNAPTSTHLARYDTANAANVAQVIDIRCPDCKAPAGAFCVAARIDIHARREEMRKHSREQAESIFRLADINIIHTWELANGYWPDSPDYDDVRRPWWLFLTPLGLIQIGWRKRVLHIQWDQCRVRGLVTTDDVTKEETYVHAYTVEKAIEYIRALRLLDERDRMARGEIAVSTEEWARRHAEMKDRQGAEPRGHRSGCASTRGSGGDDCDCGWTS